MRWVRNMLLGLLGLAALVWGAAYLVFESRWGRRVLREQIEARLNEVLIGGGSVGRVTGNPLSKLVLEDVVLGGPDQRPAIRVSRVTIDLPLLPLISRQARIDKAIVDGLEVHVRVGADGKVNVSNLVAPGPESTWSIALPNVEIHHGHVRIETTGEVIDLDGIEAHLDVALPFGGPIDAKGALSAVWRQQQTSIDVAATVHADGSSTVLRSLVAQVGDIDLLATNVVALQTPFSTALGGAVAIYAPVHELRTLMPALRLPGDIAVALGAKPEGRVTQVAGRGALGASSFVALARADVQARLARGIVSGERLDLGALTGDRLAGSGGAFAAFELDAGVDAELPATRGIVTVWGEVDGVPPLHALLAVHTEGELIHGTVGAASTTGARASLEAALRKRGDQITLERGLLVASARDAKRATRGKAPLHGAISANLHASGTLAPVLDLAVRGHALGERVRLRELAADSVRLRIDARHVPMRPAGRARVEVDDLRRGATRLGSVTLDAANRADGALQVALRSRPNQTPWQIEADARVTLGDTIVVDLQRHFVRAAGGSEWRGDRGTLMIAPTRVTLNSFASKSNAGTLEVSGTYVRAGPGAGDFTAKLDTSIAMTGLGKAYRGTLEARVDVARARDRFSGSAVACARGLALDPRAPITLDADAEVVATSDRLRATAAVSTVRAGTARLALDVDAPEHIADGDAWRMLDRRAIRGARLVLDAIDLEQVARMVGLPRLAGRLDGDVTVTPTTAAGELHVREASTSRTRELGTIQADVEIAQSARDEVSASISAWLVPTAPAVAAQQIATGGAPRVRGEVRLAAPDRLLDPLAWQQLGARAFRGATLRARRLGFQPGMLAWLGVASDLSGELGVGVDIDPGFAAARFAVDVHDLRGGRLVKPVAANVSGVLDDQSSRIVASVYAGNITVVRVTASIPVTLDELREGPRRVRSAPLSATATIAGVPATTLATVFGSNRIDGGTIDGSVDVSGTVQAPALSAQLIARDITVPPEAGTPGQTVTNVALDASWDGARGKLALDAAQSGGGRLTARAAGGRDDLAAITASLYAGNVDIAPFVAFLPGPAGGLAGRFDANVALRGADPKTAEIAGSLRVSQGRIPIAPVVGTLYEGDVKIDVKDRVVDIGVIGKLGRGDLKLVGRAPLEGAIPNSGNLTLTLDEVQLIGTIQPIVSGALTADITRAGDRWRADMRIQRATVTIPSDKGKDLHPVGAPDDVLYSKPSPHASAQPDVARSELPAHPVIDARIAIRNVFIESEEVRGLVGGNLRVYVGDQLELGMLGHLSLARGVVELFGRRYQVDKAHAQFDGSLDPMLDLRLTHEFAEATTITDVRGRLSDPDLMLSSQPPQYAEAELLGILLGGEPGGSPQNAPSMSERVTGAGASLIGNRVAGYVRRALPVDIDVLRYEASTAISSAAVTVGTWITDTLFLAYRRRLDTRPDENAGEGEIEYWIARRLVIEGIIGDRGISGADLLWRRRW